MKIGIIAALALVAVVTQGNDSPDTAVPEMATPPFAEEDASIALKTMQSHQDAVEHQRQIILKNIQRSALKAKNQDDGFKRFAALRSKFTTFSQPEKQEDQHPVFVETEQDTDVCPKGCGEAFSKSGGCAVWNKLENLGHHGPRSLEAQGLLTGLMKAISDASKIVKTSCASNACKATAGSKCGIATKDEGDYDQKPDVKDQRHTKPAPQHKAPVVFKAVPTGERARKADAGLASGADANRKEDWKVHKATYQVLHPTAAQRKKAAKKKKKHKLPTSLKDAQAAAHHTLDTVEQTKAILRTPLVKLTLAEAKEACSKIRTASETKCKADSEHTKYYCLREEVNEEDCEQKKMNDAAACEVSHKTAYNKCFSLWQRAKKNLKTAQKKAAKPMKHSDAAVKKMAAGAKKCAELQTKANADCTTAFDKYKGKCKTKMATAIELSFIDITKATTAATSKKAYSSTTVKKSKSDKTATKAAAATKHSLKKAEDALTKQDASPTMQKAMDKCLILKNVYKRTCIKVIHEARNACAEMTSSHKDDNTNDM